MCRQNSGYFFNPAINQLWEKLAHSFKLCINWHCELCAQCLYFVIGNCTHFNVNLPSTVEFSEAIVKSKDSGVANQLKQDRPYNLFQLLVVLVMRCVCQQGRIIFTEYLSKSIRKVGMWASRICPSQSETLFRPIWATWKLSCVLNQKILKLSIRVLPLAPKLPSKGQPCLHFYPSSVCVSR